MDKRQVGGAVLSLASAGLFFILERLFPTMTAAVGDPLLILCALGVLGGLALVIFGGSKQEKPQMAGDSYNNSGSNFGHMGPINVVTQKPPLEMTAEVMQAVATQLGAPRPLIINSAGDFDPDLWSSHTCPSDRQKLGVRGCLS